MRNDKLQLDCLLSLGKIFFDEERYQQSKEFYGKAQKIARQIGNQKLSD